jgi:hypothetical protein
MEKMKAPTDSPAGTLWGTATLCLFALLTVLIGILRSFWAVSPQDEAAMLVYPDLILRGHQLYVDIATLYGPGNFYLLAGAFALFGRTVLVERIVGMGYHFVLISCCYLIGARVSWVVGLASATFALIVLIFFPVAGAYSMFGALALALTALFLANKSCRSGGADSQRRWALYAGVLTGVSYWFRLDVGAIVTLAVPIALDPRGGLRLRSFAIGGAFAIVALLAFALLVGPSTVFDSMVIDGFRTAPGRVLPIEMSAEFVILAVCIVIDVVSSFIVYRLRVDNDMVWLTRAIAVFCVGMLPAILQRADIWHYAYVGTAIMGLTIVSAGIASWRTRWEVRTPGGMIALAALATLFVVSVAFVQRFLASDTDVVKITLNGRSIDLSFSYLGGDPGNLMGLLEEVNRVARPGEKLFVGPTDLRFTNYNDMFIYFLLPQLEPVTRYLEMDPGIANRSGSGLAEQVDLADWVVLTNRYETFREPNAASIPGSPGANEEIRRHFCLHSEHGSWKLLHRC